MRKTETCILLGLHLGVVLLSIAAMFCNFSWYLPPLLVYALGQAGRYSKELETDNTTFVVEVYEEKTRYEKTVTGDEMKKLLLDGKTLSIKKINNRNV